MNTSDDQTFTTVYRLADIPAFTDEDEEHRFWASHEFSDELWDQAQPLMPDELPAPRAETARVTIPINVDTLERIKALAHTQHKEYRTLLTEFVSERLDEEEKRLGLSPVGLLP